MSNSRQVNIPAFTAKYPDRASSIVIECGISKPFTPSVGATNPDRIPMFLKDSKS